MKGPLAPLPARSLPCHAIKYYYGDAIEESHWTFEDPGGVEIVKKYIPYNGLGTMTIDGVTVPWKWPTLYHHFSHTQEPIHAIEIGRDDSLYRSYDTYAYKYARVYGFTSAPNAADQTTRGSVPYFLTSTKEPYFTYNEMAKFNTDYANKFGEGASLGISAATFKQDVIGLAQLASDIVHLIRGIKKGNINMVKRALNGRVRHRDRHGGKFNSKTVANRYLEYTYALTPMVQDAYDTYETLRKSEALSKLHRFRKSRKFDSSHENESGSISGFRVLRCTCWYEVSSPEIRKASQLGLLNPALIAWDLVPYSFVLDWIMPIGNYLHALSAYAGVTFKAGYLTKYADVTVNARSSFREPKPIALMTKHRYKVYHRTPLGSFPEGQLHFKNPFSTAHVINAAALIRNRFR